ncbi:MAG: hypothetical protein NVV82_18770 [Sporocytophaga sp.]|nr:hypothetical protein [Sporocytophaga sp.]
MIRVFFLFLLCTNVYGQIDTSKISISTKQYYEFDYGPPECDIDYDSVINDVKAISYPIVKTPDETLNKVLNNNIRKISGVHELKGSFEKTVGIHACEDYLSEYNLTYILNFKNSRYLSFTFSTDWYSGGGGSGVTHGQVALTFDMANSKTLLLKDIIIEQYDTEVYNISISQLKKVVPALFGEYGESSNPQLFDFTSTLNFPIAIKKEGVVIYWNLSWGARSAAEEVIIRFDKYSHIFNRNFLKAVKRE